MIRSIHKFLNQHSTPIVFLALIALLTLAHAIYYTAPIHGLKE